MAMFVPQAELPVSEQAQIRREKLAALQAEGRDPFLITKFDFNADSAAIKADYEAFEGKVVRVAGRMMSKRGQGKVMFCDLQDSTGRIQLFVKIDEMGEEEFNRFKKNDIGDILGCEGEVFKTKTGEISVRTSKITLLSKSLPLGCPRAPALGALLHASNLHWLSILHMVMYVSMLYSQIVPLSPPTESRSLFFTSMSPLC